MGDFKLGIYTGFAHNRFPEPEEWTRIVGKMLNLHYVQFTASLLNPSMPDNTIKSQIQKINEAAKTNNVTILHTFTDSYTQLNHLAHPDKDVRSFWIDWFKKFAYISAELGAESMGSHFGIFSVHDMHDEKRRKEIFEENLRGWAELSDHAKSVGLKYLTWEPMSVPREQGETIAETMRIHEAANKVMSIPMKFCLDIDHGSMASKNSDDTDPYAWLRAFGKDSPVIHIKQSPGPVGGPWPFTLEYNEKGRIIPQKVLDILRSTGAKDCMLTLELNAPGREPWESKFLDNLKTSVEYWREHVSD